MDTICAKCGSKGPFSLVANGERCGACGSISPLAAPTRYEQVPDPPRPLPSTDRISPKNPLGM